MTPLLGETSKTSSRSLSWRTTLKAAGTTLSLRNSTCRERDRGRGAGERRGERESGQGGR